jgi:diacylglycerol kinase family enzyme
MSQENFKAIRNKRAEAQHPTPSDQSAVCKLSVNSNPDGAEIEIDGEFRGDTPSTLEIAPGEHAIKVRKTGYKAWEKKLKLAGAITLNADLEAE